MRTEKHFYIFIFLLMVWAGWPQQVQAQISPNRRPNEQQPEVDREEEEEKQKNDTIDYGFNTTHFFLEDDIKFNRQPSRNIDTTLAPVYNYTVVDRHENMLQNLGNVGTAITPIFYTPPQIIGVTSGFNAYNYYFMDPKDVKYYNTQSPYTQIEAIFGGNSRNITDVTFSGNITPEWNIGARYLGRNADKQLGAQLSRGDRLTTSSGINFFTHYHTRNNKYQVFFDFSWMNHKVEESGGIVHDSTTLLEDLFEYEDASIYLHNAYSREVRYNFHAYHQYALKEFLQVYHEIDFNAQKNQFIDSNLGATSDGLVEGDYFARRNFIQIDDGEVSLADSTSDETRFSYLQNELGVKGNIGDFFYNFYLKNKIPRFTYNHLVGRYAKTEQYYGGRLNYNIGEKISLGGEVEYLSLEANKIYAYFKSPFIDASYLRQRSLPSYLSRTYYGNHNEWYQNDFSPIDIDQLEGRLKLDLSFLSLQPFLTATNVFRPVYFVRDTLENSRQAISVQSGGAAQMLSPGVDLHIKFLKNWNFKAKAVYTLVSGRAEEAFPIPDFFVNASLFYHRIFMNGKIVLETGLDAHHKSSYFAYDYDPAIQQFFVQREFKIPTFVAADFFFSLKVRRTRLFVKIPQINQQLSNNPGYFVTPYYTGQPFVVDLGVNWQFFD